MGHNINLEDCTYRHQYLFQRYCFMEGGSGSMKEMGSIVLPQNRMLAIKTPFRDVADVGGCPLKKS